MKMFDAEMQVLPANHPKVIAAAAALRELRKKLLAADFSEIEIAEALLSEAVIALTAARGALHVAGHLRVLGAVLVQAAEVPPGESKH